MTNGVALLRAAGGALLCLSVAYVPCLVASCKEENKVPERVWAAALAACEKRRECDGSGFAEYYDSLEECAEIRTKHFPWDEYSQPCTEAWIIIFQCQASEPCSGGTEDPDCVLAHSLRSYHCWRLDTAAFGIMCGSDWDACANACPQNDYTVDFALCSAETPDYCNCGGEQCGEGEHCCYCAYNF